MKQNAEDNARWEKANFWATIIFGLLFTLLAGAQIYLAWYTLQITTHMAQ